MLQKNTHTICSTSRYCHSVVALCFWRGWIPISWLNKPLLHAECQMSQITRIPEQTERAIKYIQLSLHRQHLYLEIFIKSICFSYFDQNIYCKNWDLNAFISFKLFKLKCDWSSLHEHQLFPSPFPSLKYPGLQVYINVLFNPYYAVNIDPNDDEQIIALLQST